MKFYERDLHYEILRFEDPGPAGMKCKSYVRELIATVGPRTRRPMRIRGALHVHSKLSRDGTMTIAELVHWYKRTAISFSPWASTRRTWTKPKSKHLREQSAANSNDQFCVIPGIEFAVNERYTHCGNRCRQPDSREDPAGRHDGQFTNRADLPFWRIRSGSDGMCPRKSLLAVDAAEIWNVGYDGKYLPSPKALSAFRPDAADQSKASRSRLTRFSSNRFFLRCGY